MRLNQYVSRISNEDATSVDVEIKDEAAVAAEPEEIEAVAAELVEVDTPAKNDVDEIKEYQDIQFSLEQFQEQLNAAKQRGGLRPEEAALIGTQLRFFQKRLGMTKVASLEDYTETSRVNALTISQENLAEAGKTLITKLLEMVRNAIEQVKRTLQHRYSNSAKVRNIAEFIKAKSKNWTGKVVSVSLDNTLLSPTDFPQGLKELDVFVSRQLDNCLNMFEGGIRTTGSQIRYLLDADFKEEEIAASLKFWETAHPFNMLQQSGKGAQLSERVSVVISQQSSDATFRGLTTTLGILVDGDADGVNVSLQAAEVSRLIEQAVKTGEKLTDINERYTKTLDQLNKLIGRLNAGELAGMDEARIATIRQVFIGVSSQLCNQYGRVLNKACQLNDSYAAILARAAAQMDKSAQPV